MLILDCCFVLFVWDSGRFLGVDGYCFSCMFAGVLGVCFRLFGFLLS